MTNLHLHLQKAKRLGVNLTVLATSISLAACGGGGSEGYYGNNNSGTGGTIDPNTGKEVKEATGIALTLSKDQLNNKGDELTITAKAVDKDGGGVAGKKINLNIANALTLGATSDASEKITDDKGEVTFTVKLNGTNQSAQELLLTTTLSGTTINNVRKVVISGASAVVQSQYEIKFDSANSLKVTGGEASVRVRAVDINGGGVPNQSVMLGIKNFAIENDISIKGISTATTDNEGYANFTVQISKGNEASRTALIQSGVPLVATLTEQNGAVKTQVTTLAVASVAGLVTSLTLATSNNNKVDAVDGKIDVVVNAKNPEGLVVANQDVSLVLDEQAIQYGTKLIASTVKTDVNGNATFSIQTEANSLNPTGQLLVQNGITTTASLQASDGTVISSQSTKISVVSTITDEVSYLSLDTSKIIDISGGSATVTVKAIDKNGGTLKNKSILLSVADAQKNHLSISSGSKAVTNDQGEAVFTLSYDGLLDVNNDKAIIDALLNKGVQISATYIDSKNNNISNSSILNFKSSAVLDVERLEAKVSKGSVLAVNDSVVLTVSAINSQGKAAVNQKLTLNLMEAALNNGVTLDGSTSKNTNDSGQVQYTLKVNAANKTQIANLLANDLVLAVSTTSGKTQTTRIEVTEPTVVENTVSKFVITPSKQSVSILGDSVVIGVQALDSSNNAITDREVNFALSPNTSGRVSLDKAMALTNSKGFAYFTIKVSEGGIDEALLKDSITFAVNTFNNSTPVPVTQVGKINVSAPQEATNLTVSSSKAALLASGDTAEIYTKLVDQAGVAVKSYPVSLVVVDSALNGVTIEGANNAITDASGNAKFNVKLTKITDAQYQALLANGVTVRASITLANGIVRTRDVRLDVEAAVNPNHLEIISSNDNLSVNGDKAIITVRLLTNALNQPVADQRVTLKVKKTNSTTGTNIGIVNEAEGNDGIADTYEVTTDQNGNGFFTLLIPETGLDKDALFASGIELEASQIDANGITVKQVRRLGVDRPGSTALRYSLRIASNKPTLNVRNDSAEVTVTLLDQNGGRIADRYVTLNVADFVRNGASIVGASGKNTNSNGEAIFTIKIDETARNQNYTATAFDADNLILRATSYIASTQDPVTLQDFMIDVVQANVPNPVGNLTFGKSALLEKSDDGNYYTEAVSAQLVDRDGKPIANQPVTMSIDLLGIGKGFYTPAKDINGDPTRIKNNTALCFGAQLPASAQIATAFVSPQGSTNNIVTYTTDGTGKFDFRIRYLRQYAGWQTVNLTARVTINGQPVQNLQSGLNYPLNMVRDDFVSEAGQPFDTSPYGTTNTCP